MSDKPISVMISSTARDLPMHRDQARLGCQRSGIHPDQMMENGTATDADAVQLSLELVEQADVYICILALRYGTVPPGQDISITEMEYNRAVELNKPRLVFFIHEDHDVKAKDMETGPGAAKLQALKDRIGTDRVAAFFKSPEDLRGHVHEALTAWQRRKAEDAGENSTDVAAKKITRALSIPKPPDKFIAHPYTLLQSRDLIGRQSEQNLLTQWVTHPQMARTPIFNLVAIGGMGKSALAWK
ncbi:MAG: DUF4062 domain-containing protein [Pseudomonadota bacterium]